MSRVCVTFWCLLCKTLDYMKLFKNQIQVYQNIKKLRPQVCQMRRRRTAHVGENLRAIICNRRTTPTWALLLLRIWHTWSRRNAVWRIIRQTSNSLAKEHNQTHFYDFTTPLSPSLFDELKNSVFPPWWLAPVPATSPTWSPPPLCKQALRQVKESNRSRQRHKLGTRQNSFGLIRRAYTVPQWKDARKEAVDKRYCIQAIPLWAREREKNDIWGIRRVRPLKQAAERLYSTADYSAVCKKLCASSH